MSMLRQPLTVAMRQFKSASILRKYSTQNAVELKGIYPPMVTPFLEDESIAYDQIAANLAKYAELPFSGYVVHGSNGEYPYLEAEEKIQIVKFVKDLTKDSGKPVIAGSGCESTKATIQLTEKMAHAGANAVMVVTPSYYKGQMTDSALIAHYTAVADNSPIPVILYSVPVYTGIDLTPKAIETLAAHPNIIGMKDSGGDVAKLASLVHNTKAHNFKMLVGSASILLPGYLAGCVGGVCALANVLGAHLLELHTKYHDNIIDSELQRRLIDPNTMITKRHGVPGMKAALDILGYYGGPNRKPMQNLNEETRQAIRHCFAANGFIPSL